MVDNEVRVEMYSKTALGVGGRRNYIDYSIVGTQLRKSYSGF